MLADYVMAKYIRLSIDDAKTESLSIENQRLILDRFIEDMDIDNADILEFVDNGYTGTNFERPGIQELLELVRAGKVNCIMVKDFSRFGRIAIETGYFLERVFPLFGVRFISVTDEFDSQEHEGNTGGLEISFKFLIHEHYSRDLSQKIRSSRWEKAQRGELVTLNCAYGYTLDSNRNMVIDSGPAETVKLIFDMYASGSNYTDIEKRLYAERQLTPSAYKNLNLNKKQDEKFQYIWHKNVVYSILRDEQYAGVYIAGKRKAVDIGQYVDCDEADWIRIPNHHPVIIPRDLFDTVQEMLNNKKKPLRKREVGTSKRYPAVASPLKGKVFCGHCGHAMTISSTKNAAFHCYYTRSATDMACHKLRILQKELEETILQVILGYSRSILDRKALSATGIEAPDYFRQMIDELEDRKRMLYESLVLGAISSEEFKSQKSIIDAEIKRKRQIYELSIKQEQKNAAYAISVNLAKEALEMGELTIELADLLLERVLVYPNNKIEVIWKISAFADCYLCVDEKNCSSNKNI